MYKGLTILSAILLLSSCDQSAPKSSNFDLEKDVYDFSNKLEDGDTLFLFVDASLCTSVHMDTVIFTKKGTETYLKTKGKPYNNKTFQDLRRLRSWKTL